MNRPLACLSLGLALVAAALRADVTVVKIPPRDTDAAIGTEFNAPHFVYVDRGLVVDHQPGHATDRHQLFVFLPGTFGTGRGGSALCELAASLGYHVISLTYRTDIAAAELCRNDSNPAAFEQFRLALIRGGRFSSMKVAPADSIENRLVKLLQFLAPRRPREAWNQFLTADGALNWPAIAVAGQSQGGGHAALLGILHPVARVVCFGAPKDYSQALRAPAAWYRERSATPKSRFYAFNHVADHQGCSPAELLDNVTALGLAGPAVDVARSAPPYGHSHVLMTSEPHTTNSREAHGSVITPKRAKVLAPVWTYLLTASDPAAAAG